MDTAETVPTGLRAHDASQQIPIADPLLAATANPIRVFLIEDHPLVGDGLQALFAHDGGFELIGQTGNGGSAMTQVRYLQPDVIMLDIGLPGINGLDLVNQLRRICPAARTVILTAHQEYEYLTAALRLDVDAFLPKDMPGTEILRALRRVLSGERVIGQPQALTAVLKDFGRLVRERERERAGLTDQEIEILRLAARGLNNKDIGATQFWSEITVKRKMQDIYRKLEVKSRAQAVAAAIRLGFI